MTEAAVDQAGLDPDLVIQTRALARSFDDVQAVRGVDLHVRSGEIYGFLGPNGAGKSTVVKMLITLLRPTSGSALVLGHDVVDGAHEIRLRIGAALQDASLDEKQSGREILRMQGALYGLTRSETDARIDELSTLVDIDAIDRWIGTYSGGMRRRLDLAASLIHNPDLLFLDEPTTGLDPTSRAQVWKKFGHSTRSLVPRSFSRRSTSKRPTCWPTGSASSTLASSSAKANQKN